MSQGNRDVEEAKRAFRNSSLQQPYDEGAASTPPVQARTLGFSATFSGQKKQTLGAAAAAGRFSSSFSSRDPQTPTDTSSPNLNPRVAQALKEITTSPSPKVSALVEKIKEKVKKNEAAAERNAQLQMHRSAMLADAAKVRAVRKKRADAAETDFRLAQLATKEAGDHLQAMQQRAAAARHTYNELQRRPSAPAGTLSEAQGLADREEAALAAAHTHHQARMAEEDRARAAAETAHAEHQDAVRNEENVKRSSQILEEEQEAAEAAESEEDGRVQFSPYSLPSNAPSPAQVTGLQLNMSDQDLAASMGVSPEAGAHGKEVSRNGASPGSTDGVQVGEIRGQIQMQQKQREEEEERESGGRGRRSD